MEAKTLQRRIERTLRTLTASGALLKGSVSQVRLGKKQQGRGERIAYLLTYKAESQVTRSLYVPKARLPAVTAMIRNYRHARKALAQLVELNVQLFKATRPQKGTKSP